MANDIQTWLEMVGQLAAENASVRINLTSSPVEEGGRITRARVLAMVEDGVSVIEEPGIRDLGNRLHPGDELDILVVKKQTRLVGRCKVKGYTKHALNETTRLDAIEVTPPSKVYSGQLRDFYRAPVGPGIAVDPVQVQIDPADTSTWKRADQVGLDPGKVHKTRLVNISGGGMGLAITIEKNMARVFQVGTEVMVHSVLPTLDKPLTLKARIVHAEKLQNGDIYLGVSFKIDDAMMQKQIEDQLQRLSVWLQRHMLKKENK